MRIFSDKRMVAGIATAVPVFWPAVRSKNVVAVTATPKTPMPLGARLIFALGATAVVHSPSSARTGELRVELERPADIERAERIHGADNVAVARHREPRLHLAAAGFRNLRGVDLIGGARGVSPAWHEQCRSGQRRDEAPHPRFPATRVSLAPSAPR